MDYAKVSDRDLARAYREGDAQAFLELSARYLKTIRICASSFREIEADDLYQEGLIALMTAARGFREETGVSFATYAESCILHRFISIRRKLTAKKTIPAQNLTPIESEEDGPAARDLGSDPETFVIEQENLQRLRSKISSLLSPLETKILALYLSGYKYGEICEKLSLKKKSVDNALSRVRRKIRASFP